MLIVDDYQIDIQKAFYENDQSVIYECVKTQTKEKFLCKVLLIDNTISDSLNELEVLKTIQKVQHLNIVKIHEIKQQNKFAYIIMEPFQYNLEQYLQQKGIDNRDQVCSIVSQIVNGYKELRRQKIVLRNLNLNSIYIQMVQGRQLYKITDFTYSHLLDQKINSKAQSLNFAPEVLNMNGIQDYNEQCDVYSLGILIYRLCFQGNFPGNFKDQLSLNEFHNKLRTTPFTCPQNQNIPYEFIKLIENMIVYDPKRRCSWEQLDSSPKLQLKFIIWKDKYLIDLTAVFGKGAQGQILETSNLQNNNQKVLAKKVNIQNQPGQREKQIYQSLIGHNNQNIIQVLDICEYYQSKFCYLILEKGELNLKKYFEQKQNFNKEEIIDFIEQIVNGYCFLKNKKIIHRDLKPNNIVIVFDSNKKPIYKLINFDEGKILTQSNMPWTQAGSPLFQAPEVYRVGKDYDHICDIFSFGFILFYMIFKQYPCNASNEQELIKWHDQIKQNPFRWPNYQDPEICELIEKMLEYDRTKRITWEQLQTHSLIVNSKRQIIQQLKQLQQQQNNKQQTQNDLLLQQKKSKLIKIVEFTNNLNKCNENNENNEHNGTYNNYQCVHNLSELKIIKEFNKNQNQDQNLQKSNQQTQAINNQNNISQVNEINLAEYVYQIMQLTRKFIDTAEDNLNKVQEFQYQLIMLNYFALRFLIACFVILDKIYESQTIEINGVNFQTNRTQTQNLNINPEEILTYIKEKEQAQESQIGQISSEHELKKYFIKFKQIMDREAQRKKEKSIEICFAHKYFKIFYLTFQDEISSNPEIPLLLRFLLEKMNNIFNEFPVTNPLRYQLKQIFCKIIINSLIEKYLKEQRFRSKFILKYILIILYFRIKSIYQILSIIIDIY